MSGEADQTLLVEPDGSTLMVTGQVAEYLGISKYRARALIQRGVFGPIFTQDDKGEGIHPSVRHAAVLDWMQKTGGSLEVEEAPDADGSAG